MRALDTIISNGTGQRLPVILKHLRQLRRIPGWPGDSDAQRLLDEAMAHVAAELDDATILAIATEAMDEQDGPPAFRSAVAERLQTVMQQGGARTPANDPIRVAERRAAPRTPSTEADNPITMARRVSPDDLERIAELPALPEAITNVIAQRGIRGPILKALANPGARFSRSSLTMLAAIAPGDRPICLALAARGDLPISIQSMLQPLLPAAA